MKIKTHCSVSTSFLNFTDAYATIADDACGAYSSFLGVVREFNFGRKVCAVEYEVLMPLAKNIFEGLCKQARDRWNVPLNIYIEHFNGLLKVSEPSVLIIVASIHRKEAIETCDWLIEMLKHKAPIWKKEYYEDGETEWVEGHALCQHR